MTGQELYIKNMVCDRCIRVVRDELERLGYTVTGIELGRATLTGPPVDPATMTTVLERHGFALLTDRTTRVVSQVKTLIINLIQSGQIAGLHTTLSDYLSEQVGLDYAHLSHLFSTTENLTIEKFWIMQRVERAKELLIYAELPISEIARQFGVNQQPGLPHQPVQNHHRPDPGHLPGANPRRPERLGLDLTPCKSTKTMKTINLLIALLLVGVAPAIAQHQHGAGDHKHGSPHGGMVKSAGNYHLELLQKDSGLTVYLLDAAEKPMSVAGATATALLQTADGKVTTLKLAPTGPQQFSALPDKASVFRKAIVNVSVRGRMASASFDLATVSTDQAAHKH